MKQITTGTKITFKETGDKFTLTQTDTGFDVKQVKLSKNVPAEPYTFHEFLDQYEQGNIAIDGFEDTDAGLIHSILTNYIYQTNLKDQLVKIEKLQSENEKLQSEKKQLEEALSAMNEN